MAFDKLPTELHLRIARFMREERRNNHHGIVSTCKALRKIYLQSLYEEPYLTNGNDNPFSLLQFFETIYQSGLRHHVQALEVEIELGVPSAPSDYNLKLAIQRLPFGVRIYNLWANAVLRRSTEALLGLILLQLTSLKQFTLTSTDHGCQSTNICPMNLFHDLSFSEVQEVLPPIRYIKSGGVINQMQFMFPTVSKAKFVAHGPRTVGFGTLPWDLTHNQCARHSLTSLSVHFEIGSLLGDEEFAKSTRTMRDMKEILQDLMNLRVCKIKLFKSEVDGEYKEGDEFEVNMNALGHVFSDRNVRTLETLELKIQKVPRFIVEKMKPMKSLQKLGSLKHLVIPQPALHRAYPNHLGLYQPETVRITEADASCNLIAIEIIGHLAYLPALRHIQVEYRTQQLLEEDPKETWEALVGIGIEVSRGCHD